MAGEFTPYSTVAPFFKAKPTWVPIEDQERLAAYDVYREIYWNHPETFRLVARGADNLPIYVPAPKIVIETINRYLGKGFGFMVTPDVGTPAQVEQATLAMTALFRREKITARFTSQKRLGLIQGDWVWHITADPTKPAGTRISIHPVLPETYFPQYTGERLTKIYLAEQFTDVVENKVFVRAQIYERMDNGQISSAEAILDPKEWWLPTARLIRFTETGSPRLLPPQITAFPVYHIKNTDETGNPWGSSELRGLERVAAGINQAISDEDMALALEGLGVYATDAGQPLDENDEPTEWIIGPGRVLEHAGDFKRISGVGSVTPYTDHIGTLKDFLYEAAATGDAARGSVDVTIAQSGIALRLHLAPTLARVDEKLQEIDAVHTQMFFDLRVWFQIYEQMGFNGDASGVGGAEILPSFKDPVPINTRELLENIVMMMSTDPPIMSATTARERLAEVGIVFAVDELERIAQEAQLRAESAAVTDPFAARAAQELAQ